MAQIMPNQSGKLEFSYESDAAASFLVLKCDAQVLEYQALMLGHNHIRHVIPVDVIRKEGVTCFYYNITSKISLSFYLSRQKFNRDEFLRLLLNIASAVNDSGGYLLEDSNFLFNPEYIFINPETLEPDLIYIPVALKESGGTQLAGLVSDLVLCHINVDGFGSGNLVQRILASVKSEVFNIKEFITLLSDLLYVQDSKEWNAASVGHEMYDMNDRHSMQVRKDAGDIQVRKDAGDMHEMESFKGMKDMRNMKSAQGIKGLFKKKDFVASVWNKKEGKCEGKVKKVNKTNWFPVLAILIQIIMGSLIYLCRNRLANIGDNPVATYVAVAMIVLAIEVLLFKKMNGAGLINTDASKECGIIEKEKEDAVRIAVPSQELLTQRSSDKGCELAFNQKHEYSYGTVNEEEPALATPSTNTPGRVSCKTELLGCYAKGVRILKSTGNHIGDEDINIDKDDFIIGRLTGYVDYVLMNNAVGKLHAQMTCRNGACYVKDLNSVNGTFINNKRIESNKDFELKSNDRLQLANSEFVFING